MRYKGCHQAHNAKVVICALFTTPNSLKLQERRKAFSPIRKIRAISQKLYSHSQPPSPHSVSRATSPHLPRFPPLEVCVRRPCARRSTFMGRHPQTFTLAEVIRSSSPRASTWLRWSFGQPGLPQSFFVSREVFGMPIRAHHVFEGGNM